MYTSAAIFMLIENVFIFLIYMLIKKRIPLEETKISYSIQKKVFWENVLLEQEIKDLPKNNENENEQNQFSTPRNEHITQQFWFLQKFFLQYTLLNYTHIFHLLTLIKKEWKLFGCRNNQLHWLLFILPLFTYQISAFISQKLSNLAFLIGAIFLFGILNLIYNFCYKLKINLDENMHKTCLKITKLRELFLEEKIYQQEYKEQVKQDQTITNLFKTKNNFFPNLEAYNTALNQNSQPKFIFSFFIFTFLVTLIINDISWELTFGWLYGIIIEQFIRVIFCLIYSKKLTNKWILQGPDQIYNEMQILAEYYKPMMIVTKSPQKYIINDGNANSSQMSKDQSNSNMLNHNSTHDLIKRHNILRITSANVGTIEDTKLDITENVKELPIDSDQPLDKTEHNKENQNHTEMDTQPEDNQFKRRKVQRVKLEALYHSKVTNRSPKPKLPRPQFYSSQKRKQKQQQQQQQQDEEVAIKPMKISDTNEDLGQNFLQIDSQNTFEKHEIE